MEHETSMTAPRVDMDPQDQFGMSPLHYTELESTSPLMNKTTSGVEAPIAESSRYAAAAASPLSDQADSTERSETKKGDSEVRALQKLPSASAPPMCDAADSTESSETRKDRSVIQACQSRPVDISTVPSLCSKVSTQMNSPKRDSPLKTKESAEGSTSISDTRESSSGPLHEKPTHLNNFVSLSQPSKSELLHRFSLTSMRGNLKLINLTGRGLDVRDSVLIKQAMTQCPHLSVLKLSYNNFGDHGTAIIASGLIENGSHHESLSVLDLGFNNIGDSGCLALALHAVAGNQSLRTLYLAGNNILERGALALAGAILHGSNLSCLHLTGNQLGTVGLRALTRAIAQTEAVRLASTSSTANNTISKQHTNIMQTVQELHVGGTSMKTAGFLSISNMVLTNRSLRILNLSDNNITDSDMALFSQSIGQNRTIPFEILTFSLNNISCAGVECLMNAIWGSKTLRELRLDNNRIKDRGAQLAAVALTSIQLQVLDLGFNKKITTTGLKTIMKSLSETSSLTTLCLSGIPVDMHASKAICYALAYNNSLRSLYIDNCFINYSSQRHIAAGLVSNKRSSLQLITGFAIGAITTSLGLPRILEEWSNHRVLKFVRLMWRRWHLHEVEMRRAQQLQQEANPNGNQHYDSIITDPTCDVHQIGVATTSEPTDPQTVVIAAKNAMTYLQNAGGEEALSMESYARDLAETSPIVPANATMLEQTHSGTVRVPSCATLCDMMNVPQVVEPSEESEGCNNASDGESWLPNPAEDPSRRINNAQWFQAHCRLLNEVAHLPFSSNDFLQLYRYFYSAKCNPGSGEDNLNLTHSTSGEHGIDKKRGKCQDSQKSICELRRVISLHCLNIPNPKSKALESKFAASKRRTWEVMTEDSKEFTPNYDQGQEPITKRAKNSELRISLYPRLKGKLDALMTDSEEGRVLALLRQLQFIEDLTLRERDTCTELPRSTGGDCSRSHSDIEMVLLDLL